jgi:hypothetical protein
MLRVLAASVAELLDLELLGLRALVLVGDVVVALAILARELDEVSHLGRSNERITGTITTTANRRTGNPNAVEQALGRRRKKFAESSRLERQVNSGTHQPTQR